LVFNGKTLTMRVAFRVDASLAIGSGHVMRCVALAQGLAREQVTVHFICRALPGNLIDWIQSQGFSCFVLPPPHEALSLKTTNSDYAAWLGVDWQQDAMDTLAVLTERVDWLVVDHYALAAPWQKAVSKGYHRLFVIDDLANRDQSCADLLLDQNYSPHRFQAYAAYVGKQTTCLFGPKYALLRDEFRQVRLLQQPYCPTLSRICIFLGGVDADNLTGTLVEQLSLLNLAIGVDVIIGAQNPHRAMLTALCRAQRDVTLHVGISNLAEVMSMAQLVIGAGGVNTWERAVLGLPTLALCIADNQRAGLLAMAEQGALWLLQDSKAVALAVSLLANHPTLLNAMHLAAQKICDGLGVARVVQHLLQGELRLVAVGIADAEQLFAWRNHPSIRAVSRSREPIIFEQHYAWLAQSLENTNRVLWLALQGEQAVGMIRFDRVSEEDVQAEVSLYLAPEQIGKGLGRALLAAGERQLRTYWPRIRQIKAEVLPNNPASLALFQHAGYDEQVRVFYKQVNE
jgi:UDP-2,4-diacetamido-2,4,6-trideoxy-beta-L-altropyranose hydrolase